MYGDGPISPFTGVPGWHSHEESQALVKYAQRLPSATIVELGGEYGKSASEFLYATVGAGSTVHTVDTFPDNHPVVGNLLRAYRENIATVYEQLQVPFGEGGCRTHVGTTDEVAADWDDDIDLLFVDAGHGYNQIVRDIQNWVQWVVMGGYVLFHDYAAHQNAHFLHHEVKKAVDRWWNGVEPFEHPASEEFEFIEQIDSLRIYQRKIFVPLFDEVDEDELPLTDIKGVGENRANQLVEAGITTVRQLANKNPDELVELLGNVSRKQVDKLQKDAQTLLDA